MAYSGDSQVAQWLEWGEQSGGKYEIRSEW